MYQKRLAGMSHEQVRLHHARVRHLLKCTVLRLMQQQLSEGWRTWRTYIDRSKHWEDKRKWVRQQREDTIARTLLGWRQRQIKRVLNTWKSNANTGVHQRRLLRQVKVRVVLSTLSKAWSRWRDCCTARVRLREWVVRRCRAYTTVLCTKSWRRWLEVHRYHTLKEERQATAARAIHRVVQRMRRQRLWSGMSVWISRTSSLRRHEQLLVRCRATLLHRTLVRSWRSWLVYVSQEQTQRTRMARVRSRMVHALLWRCFVQWCHFRP